MELQLREMIEKEFAVLRNEIHQLRIIVSKDKFDTTWINEDDAAGMFGLTVGWFRRSVKGKKFPFENVDYRHTNNRNFQYNRKALLRAKEKSSVQA